MAYDQPQRELGCEQLTVAKETFTEFKKVFIKHEEEVGGQPRLVDFTRIPLIILHRIDYIQHPIKEDKVFVDQQFCDQQGDYSLEHEEPGPLPIKEQDDLEYLLLKEERKLSISQDEEQNDLKQESDAFTVTPFYEKIYNNEPNGDKFVSHGSAEAENQDEERSNPGSSETIKGNGGQETGRHGDSSKQKGLKTRNHKLYLDKISTENISHDDDLTEMVRDHMFESPISNVTGEQSPNTHDTLTKSFLCTTCGKSFTRKFSLTAHRRVHTGEKPFLCTTCGKRFSRSNTLSDHIKIHTGEKPFSCISCGKTFSLRNVLSNHIKIHTGEKPFSCKMCRKKFTQKCHLTEHIKIHTGEKPFSCITCGKRFSQRYHLSNHMKIHTGERPFSCITCKKDFCEKRALSNHMKIHTGEKPFSCITCKKSFTQKCHLTAHLRIHTGEKPFSCMTCRKAFKQKCHLTDHLRIHTGEKPFSCMTCGKLFSQRHHLSNHMKIHRGERVYSCMTCGKLFSQRHHLSNHMKIHSSEKTFSYMITEKSLNEKITVI